METRTPMQRVKAAENYSHNFDIQLRRALQDPYTSMAHQEQKLDHADRDYEIVYTKERSKKQDRLAAEYRDELSAWDWEGIIARAVNNAECDPDCNEGELVGRYYLGTVMSLYPSGKYYTAWTSNQTDFDCLRDETFQDALEALADEHGGYIQNGEGDPCDLFFCIAVESAKEEEPAD